MIKTEADRPSPTLLLADFSSCKICGGHADKKYQLKWVSGAHTIYSCRECGLHYLDYLDGPSEVTAHVPIKLSEHDAAYISGKLQSNSKRFKSQMDLVARYVDVGDARILDIGAGGGLFLNMLKACGAEVAGIEPNLTRVAFARKEYGIDLSSQLISEPYWQDNHQGSFDAICMWDVIEHVNDPLKEVQLAANLLKPGGYFFLDTPNRHSLYYRIGEWSYALSKGGLPLTLRMAYSPTSFAHKQIFTVDQLTALMCRAGLSAVAAIRIHEHSFPCEFYLKRLLRNDTITGLVAPLFHVGLSAIRVRNKVVVVAQRCI